MNKGKEAQKEIIDKANYSYSNLLKSLILFAASSEYLESLNSPSFNVVFELETEFDIGFNELSLNSIFDKKLINRELKNELSSFKAKVIGFPNELWMWKNIKNHIKWNELRTDANILLDKMEISNREYIDDSIIIEF